MPIVDIEFQEQARERLALFIRLTAEAIENGYGAGNCTPESEAFWAFHRHEDVSAGWCILRIEVDGVALSDHEIGAAIRKVGTTPTGEIEAFGATVGRWRQMTDLPIRKEGLIAP